MAELWPSPGRAEAERPFAGLLASLWRRMPRRERNEAEAAVELGLARAYAENRLAAAAAITALSVALGLAAQLWAPGSAATLWLAGLLACHVLSVSLARSFLATAPNLPDLPGWVARFAAAEFLLSLAWVSLAVYLDPASAPHVGMFCACVLLTGIAASASLSTGVPLVLAAGTVPAVAAVTVAAAIRRSADDAALALFAGAAALYFALLSGRLNRTKRRSLELRGEKDALIAELEQARANAEEARRRAEDANLAKSRFLATMSHELRTPLNAILGFSEIMKDEILGAHAVNAYGEYAADIHSSGEHLLSLINEVLDLSRIEAGRYELGESALDLASVALECRKLLAMRAKTRRIELTQAVEVGLPPLWADEKAIRQVCLNLLSNAIKFTPEGGTVSLKVGWTASGGQYVAVRDTGPGIPEDEIATVLTPFGQGTSAMRTAEQGAGLGLPIVHGLIELHGGALTLRSKPGAGTEAIATFPSDRVLLAESREPATLAAVQ
jgi:two-component system, cell cycle sensor histidine kinase PleC